MYALSKDFKIKNLCGSKKACLHSETANLQPFCNSLILMEASQETLGGNDGALKVKYIQFKNDHTM